MFAQAQRTAVELQRALLTDPGLPHPNLQLATRYLPSGMGTLVGGDWFETVRLHFGRTLLAMGDVMGHGVEAAVDMNSYRSALRDFASADLPPHRVLRRLDQDISDADTRRPATCLLARLDPARGLATFSSAGHLPPVVFNREGVGDLIRVPVGPRSARASAATTSCPAPSTPGTRSCCSRTAWWSAAARTSTPPSPAWPRSAPTRRARWTTWWTRSCVSWTRRTRRTTWP